VLGTKGGPAVIGYVFRCPDHLPRENGWNKGFFEESRWSGVCIRFSCFCALGATFILLLVSSLGKNLRSKACYMYLYVVLYSFIGLFLEYC